MDNSGADQLEAAAAGAALEVDEELEESLDVDFSDDELDELDESELLAGPVDEFLPESRLSVR